MVQPTSAGKSLIPQLVACEPTAGMVVCVGPLITLMSDQTTELTDMYRKSGGRKRILNLSGFMHASQVDKCVANMLAGTVDCGTCGVRQVRPTLTLPRVVFMSPEGAETFKETLETCFRKGIVSLLFIDEAHCVKWSTPSTE